MQRTVGTLTSFGTRTFDGTKYVLPVPFTLKGDGSTIPADQYYIANFAGYVVQRTFDNSGVTVDWSGYAAMTATYTVNVSGTPTTYTNEAITFAPEVDSYGNPVSFSPIGADGQIIDLEVIDLIAQVVIAGGANVIADTNGIAIVPSSIITPILPINFTPNGQNALRFLNAPTLAGAFYTYLFGTAGNVNEAVTVVRAQDAGGGSPRVQLLVADGSGNTIGSAIFDGYDLIVNGYIFPVVADARLTGDFSITSATLVDVTGLSFAIVANEVWQFDMYLMLSQGNAAGIKVGINGPSGATLLASTNGETSGLTAESWDVLNALNTAGAVAYDTAASTTAPLQIHGVMVNGTNAGTVQLQAQRAAGTAKVLTNSYVVARKIA